jgi:tetratricopeptide (TPR) repeat protein
MIRSPFLAAAVTAATGFRRPRAGVLRRSWGALALCGAMSLLLAVESAGAQLFPLKRGMPPLIEEVDACPPVGILADPAAPRAATDSLLTAGSRAAILGDYAAAGDLLREAAALDPQNPVVAYRLARILDDQGEPEAAVLEYCRYLALAPASSEAAEVRARLRDLAPGGSAGLTERLAAENEAAIRAYDDGRFDEAAEAFTRAIEILPTWGNAHYNRALARLEIGRQEEAVNDLVAYVDLHPDAPDAGAVQHQIDQLRAPGPTLGAALPLPRPRAMVPEQVLVRGLVLPGLGQHATGRTGLGLAVLAGVGGALHYSTRQETVVRTRTALDPFGNPYEYETRSLERTHQAAGLGAAVAIAAAGALEAYVYARRAQGRSAAATPAAAAAPAGAAASPRLQLAVSSAPRGVRVGLVIRSAPPRPDAER